MARYLVTGGGGFIGSNLVDKLIGQGHIVEVWDNFSTGKRSNVHELAIICRFDIGNPSREYHVWEFDAIFHLAGEARIQPSFSNPSLVHHSNVTGTLNILDLAREYGIPVIFAGSSSVYHDVYANPYTFTKAKAEEYCWLYHKIYDVPVAIARFFNVYGPRHITNGPYATVIGVFEHQKSQHIPLTVTGDGEQRRDFTHVEDICDGLVAIVEKKAYGNTYNLGTGTNYSINEVAKMYNSDVEFVQARRGEARDTLANIDMAVNTLGWRPKRSLPEYIASFLATLG
jgi:UDP-glucose 4-epimerase